MDASGNRMMRFLRNSRSNSRLASLVLIFLVSFSLYGLYCINTVSEVKINGPYYQRIIQSKDVIADIMPPPVYLVETYLTAFQMMNSTDADENAALEGKIRRLKAEYQARHDFWAKNLAEDELKKILVVESYEPAMRMLNALENDFLPALKAGNRAQAETVLSLVIHREYSAHRAAIDRVVDLATKRNQEDEARAAVAVQSRTYGQIVLGIFLFFLLSIYSTYVVQKAEDASQRIGNRDPKDASPPPADGKAAPARVPPDRTHA